MKYLLSKNYLMGSRVAQWLERWSYEPSVEGSTPSSRTCEHIQLEKKWHFNLVMSKDLVGSIPTVRLFV